MSIEDDIIFFERLPFLALLGRPALRILAIGAEARYVNAGDTLFHAGDTADAGFLIQEGMFTLTSDAADGFGQEASVSRGVLLGEMALLTETTRAVTATAALPSTVMRISRSLFIKMLEGFPDAALRLRDHIADRTSMAVDEMAVVRSAFEAPRE